MQEVMGPARAAAYLNAVSILVILLFLVNRAIGQVHEGRYEGIKCQPRSEVPEEQVPECVKMGICLPGRNKPLNNRCCALGMCMEILCYQHFLKHLSMLRRRAHLTLMVCKAM